MIWKEDGSRKGLGHLGGDNPYSLAWDVSGDGHVVVGYTLMHGRDFYDSVAFRWTEERGNGCDGRV